MAEARTEPSEDEGRALHARLLAGDPTASADLALTYLVRLTAWLVQRNPRIHPDECATAAADAILAVIKNPGTYKPERQRLDAYLRMAASGDLKNLLRAERRHHRPRQGLTVVELSPLLGNSLQDEDEAVDPVLALEQGEDEALHGTRSWEPQRIGGSSTPAETQVLELMRLGERRTVVYAQALGITDLTLEEQRRVVKRTKDRLAKRLQRRGARG